MHACIYTTHVSDSYYDACGYVHSYIYIRIHKYIHAYKTKQVPDSYYADLRLRLGASSVQIKEDLDMIQKLNLLVDFDEQVCVSMCVCMCVCLCVCICVHVRVCGCA